MSAIAAAISSEKPKNLCLGCIDERTLWTRIWQGLAAASIGINAVAMAIEGSTAVIVAGVVACLIAPIVIYLQFQLQSTDTLRMVQNQLRLEVARLHTENNKLSAEVTQLESQVGRLQGEEKKLEAITAQQGTNVEQFVQLVRENRDTVDKLKVAVKIDLSQTLITALIDSDFDQSGTYSDQEVKILEMRMNNMPGVIVNHELLHKAVGESNRQIETVLALTSHLDRTDLADSERIFRFDDSKLKMPKLQVSIK